MSRGVFVAVAAGLMLVAAPGTASADALLDPADADELAATLADAYQTQHVCYGWRVDIDNVGLQEVSAGSNFGAGVELRHDPRFDSDCVSWVEFTASITWTSESSEREDSASFSVTSHPDGVDTADLEDLGVISTEGLAGDNGDVDLYKAVTALPLLAADAGIARPIEASPAPETAAEAANGAPTNSPGSDFWRRAGGAVVWAVVLLAGGLVFAFWAWRTRRSAPGSVRRRAAAAPPEYVPPEWAEQPDTPPDARPDPAPGTGSPEPDAPPPGSPPRPPAKPDDPETRPDR